MNGVAAIDEERIGILFARLGDECGNFGEAAGCGFGGVIVVGKDVAVKVGGGENRNVDGSGGEANGGGE